MPKKSKKQSKKEINFLIILLAAVLIILLTLLNLQILSKNKAEEKDVLGATAESEQKTFWVNLLNNEPEYLPGWVELARLQKENGNLNGYNESLNKALEIDPNYEVGF